MGIALDGSFKLYSSVLKADKHSFGNLIFSPFPFGNARILNGAFVLGQSP